MNIVKRNTLWQIAFVSALIAVLNGCEAFSETPAEDLGVHDNPHTLSIEVESNGCPVGVDPVAADACKPAHPKAPCVKPGHWISWTSEGNDIEAIPFKSADPLDRTHPSCKIIRNGSTFKCPVKGNQREGEYDYSVKLKGCELFDPKIIVTK